MHAQDFYLHLTGIGLEGDEGLDEGMDENHTLALSFDGGDQMPKALSLNPFSDCGLFGVGEVVESDHIHEGIHRRRGRGRRVDCRSGRLGLGSDLSLEGLGDGATSVKNTSAGLCSTTRPPTTLSRE